MSQIKIKPVLKEVREIPLHKLGEAIKTAVEPDPHVAHGKARREGDLFVG